MSDGDWDFTKSNHFQAMMLVSRIAFKKAVTASIDHALAKNLAQEALLTIAMQIVPYFIIIRHKVFLLTLFVGLPRCPHLYNRSISKTIILTYITVIM